jgi:predicted negative regulator of RcsB-dependent stress response
VSYQTEEQQVEQLKEWWKENGTPLIIGAVLGLSGFFGWKYWTEKQVAYQEAASDLYVSVEELLEKGDEAALLEKAEQVKKAFPDSSYAILSAFHIAKIAVKEKDLDKAVTELTWVVDTHQGNELAEIAKIRLARILVAQQKADQALPLLAFGKDSGYFELASLVKGDALMVLDKKAEALEAYKAAQSVGKLSGSHPSLQLMVDDLSAVSSSELDTTLESELKESEVEAADGATK